MHAFLKFPPLLGGDYGWGTWITLLIILAFVGAVLWFVFRYLGDEPANE